MNSSISISILVILLITPEPLRGRSVGEGLSESPVFGHESIGGKEEMVKDDPNVKNQGTTSPPTVNTPNDSDEKGDEEEDFCVIEMDSEENTSGADISSEDEDCFVLDEESHEIYDTINDETESDNDDSKTKQSIFFPRKVNTNDVVEAENNKLIADRIKSKLVTVKPPSEKWIPDQKS